MTISHFQPGGIAIELVRQGHESSPAPGDSARFMSRELAEEILDELNKWPSVTQLWFTGRGQDPLAHPDLGAFLDRLATAAVAQSAQVTVHTDGTHLCGETANHVLQSPVVNRIAVVAGPASNAARANVRAFTERAARERPDLVVTTTRPPLELPKSPSEKTVGESSCRLALPLVASTLFIEESRHLPSPGADTSEAPGPGVSCPYVESDFLYITVNGAALSCPTAAEEEFSVGRFDAELGFGTLLNTPKMSSLRHNLRLDARSDSSPCGKCPLRQGAGCTKAEQYALWRQRDAFGLLIDPDERRHIYHEVLGRTEEPVRRIDIGCGAVKEVGFLGLDRFPLPGVDIVTDLDQRLPFEDDAVDLVFASHSLEHVRDLTGVMQELYRVCRHGAQVVILAPYEHQSLNIANPYHLHAFNEHTPRFWTDSPSTTVDPLEYTHPHSPQWGLLRSDNRDAVIDFRCVGMEFFYFPEYAHLDPATQRQARQRNINVCDSILYHLLVVKEPISDEEYRDMVQRLEYYMPVQVQMRRLSDECARLQEEKDRLLRQEREAVAFHNETVRRLLEALAGLEESRQELSDRADHLHAHVSDLTSGTGWRLAQLLVRWRHRLFPRGTLRERIGKKAMRLQRQVRARLSA